MDIQGLRAIAVLLVFAFHLWPDRVTGGYVGVDVFFVISGFLITAHLLEHPPRRGHDLLAFWGRRIRRLLPAAFLVLIVTAIASRIFAPETQWMSIAGQTIASALYVQNWVLAANSVDYLAAAEPPTPVQHYWSLSVEEQFYLVWPILLLAAFWLAWRSRFRPIVVVRLAMLAIIAGSLWISITATAADPANAYFVTPTRVWELAVGGFVATLPSLGVGQLASRSGGRLIDTAAWFGIVAMLIAGFLITSDTPFPGWAALLPVGGAALVILAAATGSLSPTHLLRNRVIQHLGDTSYSIYLWHWPLIVLWPYATGNPLSPVDVVAIIALTIVLATLSKIFVEDRVRFAPRMQALVPTFRFAVVGMIVVGLLGSAQLVEAQLRLNAAVAAAGGDTGDGSGNGAGPGQSTGPDATFDLGGSQAPGSAGAPAGGGTPGPGATAAITSCIGAAAIVRGFDACPQNPAGRMTPAPVAAATDRPDVYRDGCWNYAPFSTRTTCHYGNGPIKVAVVGNSHAGQWMPALQVLAKAHGWTITTFLASQCNVTDAALEFYSAAKSQGCTAWGQWVQTQVDGSAFNLVFWSERQSVPLDNTSWSNTRTGAMAGYASYLRRLAQSGANVLVVQDTPYPGITIPDCLVKHTTSQDACGGTPSSWAWQNPLFDEATSLALPNVSLLPTTQFLCTATVCPAVIGGVVAYSDASHMTATYARSIAPFIDAQIEAALAKGAGG